MGFTKFSREAELWHAVLCREDRREPDQCYRPRRKKGALGIVLRMRDKDPLALLGTCKAGKGCSITAGHYIRDGLWRGGPIDRRDRVLTVAVSWLAVFWLSVSMYSVPPILEPVRREFHLSYSQAGILLSTPLAFLAALSILGGILADRYGLKRMVGIGLAFGTLGAIGRGASATFPTLLLSTAGIGIGLALAYPNLPKAINQLFPGKVAGAAGAIYSTAIVAGIMTAFSLTRFIYAYVGSWHVTFYIWAGLGTLPLILWKPFFKASRPEMKIASGKRQGDRIGYDWLLSWRLWLAGTLFLLLNLDFHVAAGWLPTYVVQLGIKASLAGLIVSLIPLMELVGFFTIPFLSDRIRRRKPFFVALYLSLAAEYAILPSIPFQNVWMIVALLGFSLGAPFPLIFLVVPSEIVEPEHIGRAAGVIHSVGYSGGVIGAILVGVIRDISGTYALGFYVLTIVSILAAVLSILLPETARGRKGSASQH